MKTHRKQQMLFAAAVLIFSLVNCLTILLSGDDFVWYFTREVPTLAPFASPNGRYLANQLSYFIIRYPAVRVLLYTPILFSCVWMLAKTVQLQEKRPAVSWACLLLFSLMPASLYFQIIRWLSGSAVYIVPMTLMLLFLRCCFLEFMGKPIQQKWLTPVFAVTSLAGALFVEHVSIYCCFLAGFVLIYSACRKDLKIRAYQIAYAAGTAAGTLLMFLNPVYTAFPEGIDEYGSRAMEFAFEDLYTQLYFLVIPQFAVRFFLLHLVIAGGFLVLLSRADRSKWDKKRMRYAKAAAAGIVLYTAYSCFHNAFSALEPLSPAYRVRAIECVFAFLYLISIIYLGYVLTDRNRFLRITLFCASAFFVTAIFCIASPVNDRCFFADFCFWLLLALELLNAAMEHVPAQTARLFAKFTAAAGCGVLCLLGYICTVNRLSMDLSIRHLREQLESGLKNCEVIALPYSSYDAQNMLLYLDWVDTEVQSNKSMSAIEKVYWDCLTRYYGFDIEPDTFAVREISVYNYYT